MLTLVRDLNRLHSALPALHALDHRPEGFSWVVGDDSRNSVFAYLRRAAPGSRDVVLAVVNMTPVVRPGYRLGVPFAAAGRNASTPTPPAMAAAMWAMVAKSKPPPRRRTACPLAPRSRSRRWPR